MITTDRNQFTGTHLTADAKSRLRELAARLSAESAGGRVSMSELIAEYVDLGLKYDERLKKIA